MLIPFCSFATDYTLEIRAAAFNPTCKETRKVFSQAWIDYEALASASLTDYVSVWGQVGWMVKKGVYHDRVAGWRFRDHSRAWVLPLSVGINAFVPINCRLKFYIGGGLSYSFVRLESHTNYSFIRSDYNKEVIRGHWGVVNKVGFIFDLGHNTFLDIFADYFAQRFRLGKHRCFEGEFGKHFNACGFKFGGGFGVNF